MVKDPEFIADIRKVNVELDPLPGDRVQELIVRTLSGPVFRARTRHGGVRTIAPRRVPDAVQR